MSKHKKPNDPDKNPLREDKDVSRRGFLTVAGLGVVGAAAAGGLGSTAPAAESTVDTDPAVASLPLTLTVNGHKHRLLVEARWSLLFILREKLGLTGVKVGCERGECGSCTVLIDDIPRYACMTLAVEAEGSSITTVEGLLVGEELGAVQQAFREHDAYQCGYCTSGQIVAVEGLLQTNADPSDAEIRKGVSGNLCRCGAYPNIFRAAQRAGEIKRSEGGS
jgi:xanthine dehydrogenase YagT iron-sulfur-binding subunit